MNVPLPLKRLAGEAYHGGCWGQSSRAVPEEVPVALSFRGTTHAVMMASPADLEDFALGFCLGEGLIGAAADIEAIDVVPADGGIDLQIRLAPARQQAFSARRRVLAGPVGCGLCGVDSIAAALPELSPVTSRLVVSTADIAGAVAALAAAQRLNAETRAVHGAGFFVPGVGLVAVREDVGRHNALDKLAGALMRAGVDGATGAVVLSSRVSLDLVVKTVRLGAPLLVAVSAPTALSVEVADRAGITLVAVARGSDFELFSHPDRIGAERRSDVA